MSSDLDEVSLTHWLATHVGGFSGPLRVEKFPGGQSNPTYRLDGAGQSYVLRRKPFGDLLPSAHAVDREYRLLSALYPTGFPVARPIALCEDPAVIGAIFYVMELVQGDNHWDGRLPGKTSAERRALYEAMVDTLAALHNIDPIAAGLESFGKPGNFFARQVDRWTRQYRASQTDDIPVVERLIDWLPGTAPPQTRSTIIHGDYRIDNMIFTPSGDRVLAVLDWELATIGDPLADVAYMAMNWVLPVNGQAFLGGSDLDALGIPSLDAIVARYCAAAGCADVPNLNWHFAYNLFRLTSIVQGVKKRVLDGNASNPKAAESAAMIIPLAEAAWRHAVLAGATA